MLIHPWDAEAATQGWRLAAVGDWQNHRDRP